MDVGTNAGSMVTSGSYELLAASIEQVRNKKDSMGSTMDSIRRLAREVELEEAQETKNMLVRKLDFEKHVLAFEMQLLNCRVVNMMDVVDRTLSEMWKILEKRQTSAASKNDLADEKKLENDQSEIAHQQLQIKKLLEELNRFKQETVEYTKELFKGCDLLTREIK